MTLRDLIPVTDTFRITMTERHSNRSMVILSNDPIVKKREVLDLIVTDVYADCGLNVELKFNKYFYRYHKDLFK